MNVNNTTRRHPRTLQEAFGPYASRHVYEMPTPVSRRDRWAGRLLAVGIALALAALLLHELGALTP